MLECRGARTCPVNDRDEGTRKLFEWPGTRVDLVLPPTFTVPIPLTLSSLSYPSQTAANRQPTPFNIFCNEEQDAFVVSCIHGWCYVRAVFKD